jgi:hypothetical protein
VIQFTGQDAGGWTLAGAGNHLKTDKMNEAAQAAYQGAIMLVRASDLLNSGDPQTVMYDATAANVHNVRPPPTSQQRHYSLHVSLRGTAMRYGLGAKLIPCAVRHV